jgi:septal ring factor EnvC (AmiA/AmiB activator)
MAAALAGRKGANWPRRRPWCYPGPVPIRRWMIPPGPWALLCLAMLATPALAQPSARDLREAERTATERRRAAEAATDRARALAEEEIALAGRRVEAAARAQAAEAAVDQARQDLIAARRQVQAAGTEMAARAAALRPLLPVMLRLSLWPAETVLAVPGEPEDTLRGALVLRGLVRRLEEESAALRRAEAAARDAEALAAREAAALAAAEAAAREAESALEAELAEARRRRGAAEEQEERAATRAAEAAARAGDLAEVLARLERERVRREAEERANAAARAAEAARRAAEEARERRLAEAARARAAAEEARARDEARARAASRPAAEPPPRQAAAPAAPVVPSGGRAVPVAGRVATQWGEAVAGGPHRGLTYAAAGGARVVSPCNGRAVFAAPFRSFGLLLIVDCGGGYHFVLAGLDRLDAAAGQRLLAGEPIGVLGGAGAAGGSLYVELRRNGQPVDPRPWFAARG